MAKVKIQGHASGTGILTVTAPNTSTDRTITLPDSTDTLAVNSDVTNKLPLAGGTLTGNLSLTTSGDSKIIVTSGNSGNGQIRFDDAAGTDRGRVHYEHSNDTMLFKVADTNKARLTADGLCFNSDNAAANALDDYEEGTWTPTFNGNHIGSHTLNYAFYTKIGRLVKVEAYVYNFGSITGSGVGFGITGLPFAPDGQSAGTASLSHVNTESLCANIAARQYLGTVYLEQTLDSSSGVWTSYDKCNANSHIQISLSYTTAA